MRFGAQELTERLLSRIEQASTAWVILDLTGVDIVDTPIATHLIKLASAIRLMGAECLLTGVEARMAQAFVLRGVSLEGIRPIATLREALKFCLSRSSQRDRVLSGPPSP